MEQNNKDEKVIDISLAFGKNKPINQSGSPNSWQRKQKRKMRRHTRLVFLLKAAFPCAAAILVGLVVLWPQLNIKQDEAFNLISSESKDKIFDEQVMVNPKFFTIDEKGEPINIEAADARELPDKKTRNILLRKVKSNFLMKSDRFFMMDANRAIYVQEEDIIDLLDSVNLYSEDGYELQTTNLKINLANKNVQGKERVFMRGPFGTAVSQGIQVEENGLKVQLTGKTRVVFMPGALENDK
ncbi:MAG: LPS export ABC transporter periplasmic protein LptC [Alphaproteobacteria bacterium]|nr:LPS export ABC transporter periplasmic protein LptC [Alphaproteobacteria bacterium]